MINVLAVRVSIKFNLEEFLSNFVVLNCLQNRSAVYYNIRDTFSWILCVVSNEHGGFIYDPIGSNILEYTTTTTTNTVERLNSKENLH